MKKIRVLMLEDSEHRGPRFIFENSFDYYNLTDFLREFVLEPHTDKFELRLIRYDDLCEEIEEDIEIMNAFERILCSHIKTAKDFEILWKASRGI